MDNLKKRLLDYYQIDEEGYLKLTTPLSFSVLRDISNQKAVKDTISFLETIKENKEKVLVYGDYDCDGVMSSSILVLALREFGITVNGYLPSRYLDGYGLNVANVEKIAKSGYKVIFTTDNGVTAKEALNKARELGIKTIVLDHHEFSETPPCDYLLHPSLFRKKEEVPISAGHLAFLFSKALLKRYDPYLLVLGATSTLSDTMPLKDDNRMLVRLGISALNEYSFPSFSLLYSEGDIDEESLTLSIIPKINAVGRLEKDTKINRLLSFFTLESPSKEKLAFYFNECNEKRKNLTKVKAEEISLKEGEKGIVYFSDLPEGINGLLASKLEAKYKKPVAIFSESELFKDRYLASLRAPKNFDLLVSLSKMSVSFLSMGGHPQAMGCSINKGDLNLFKKEFLSLCSKASFEEKEDKYVPLLENELNSETYDLVCSFGPFGKEFEKPKFLLSNLSPLTFSYLKDGRYLSTKINNVSLLSFEFGKDFFEGKKSVNLIGYFHENFYLGQKRLQFIVEKAL